MKGRTALFEAICFIIFITITGGSMADTHEGFELSGTQITFSEGEKWFTDWSPDGEWITYTQQEPTGEYDVWIISASGGEPSNLTLTINGNCIFPNFTADSREVTFTNNWTIKSIDISTMNVRDIRTNATNGFWSHNGRYLVYRRGDTAELMVYDAVNDVDSVIAPGDPRGEDWFWYAVPAFSAEDSHVITSVINEADESHKLYSIPTTGGQYEQVTSSSGNHWYPDYSYDGEWILYSNFIYGFEPGGHSAYAELWMFNVLTGEEDQVFPDIPVKNYCTSFSPDGSQFSYIIDNQIYIADFPFDSRVIPALQQLIERIQGWSMDGEIKAGTTKSLINQIESVIKKLEKGNTKPAINQLEAFINHIEAQRGKQVSEEQFAVLNAKVCTIISVLLRQQSVAAKPALSYNLSANEEALPVPVSLEQNIPNPFNPTTTIGYSLNQPGMVNLTIYDLLGRKVDTLVDRMHSPGSYTVTWNAEGFASGVYLYRIEFGGSEVLTQKMMLLK